MPITNAHLNWFKLKCPYPVNSTAYAAAKARLNNASYSDLERLRAEFDEYHDGSIPVPITIYTMNGLPLRVGSKPMPAI